MRLVNAPPFETAREALSNILVQRARSALALLGILIGTASIVAMLTIGHIAQEETLALFSKMGIDMLQVQAAPTGDAPAWLDRDMVETLPRRVPAVMASTAISIGRVAVANGAKSSDLALLGAAPELSGMAGLEIGRGRFLRPLDDGSLVAVVGADAAVTLSGPGSAISPGTRVRIGDYMFTIIGTLKPNLTTALDPTDYRGALIVPLGASRRVIDTVEPTTALIRLRPLTDLATATARITALLRRPDSEIQVQTARAMIETMNAQKAVHSRLLSAIGAISLLVGGIGVMNVMLMGVLERRAEIGLRAAIGASPRDLQLMFVVEAGALALLGGVAGAIGGVAIAFGTAWASGWQFSLPIYVVPFGVAISATVGVVFGLYPAVTASRLDPIEALRAA